MPSGKGPLRLAIEDFFRTSEMGKWIYGGYINFGHAIEDNLIPYYQVYINTLKQVQGLPPEFIPKTSSESGGHSQAQIALVIPMIIGIAVGVASGFVTPIRRLVEHKANNTWPTADFDPSAAINLMWRKPHLTERMIQMLKDNGWESQDIDSWFTLLHPLLSEGDSLQLWLRGLMSDYELSELLQKKGWDTDTIPKIKELMHIIPGITDLVHFADRFAWDDDIANRFQYDTEFPQEVNDWAAKIGLSPEWFKRYWRSHWQLPSMEQIFEMLHRLRPDVTDRPFTNDDLQAFLKTTPLPPYFHGLLTKISYAPYTRVDVRRMLGYGVIDEKEVYNTYRDLGYDDTHAKNLTDFTVKYEDINGINKVEKYKELALGLFKTAYQQGLITQDDLVNHMKELKYQDYEIQIYVGIADLEKVTKNNPDNWMTYKDQIRNIVESTYVVGAISEDEARSNLKEAQFSDTEIGFILTASKYAYVDKAKQHYLGVLGQSYLSHNINRSDVVTYLGQLNLAGNEIDNLLQYWDVERDFKSKHLTEAQYVKALKKDVIDEATFRDYMQGMGLGDTDIDILEQII